MDTNPELEYKTLTQLFESEGNRVWMRFNIFLVAHSLIVTAAIKLYTLTGTQNAPRDITNITEWLCGIGLALCVCWSIITFHGLKECSLWMSEICRIEKNNPGLPNILSKRSKPLAKNSNTLFNLAILAVIISFICIYYTVWSAMGNCLFCKIWSAICSVFSLLFAVCYYLLAQDSNCCLDG